MVPTKSYDMGPEREPGGGGEPPREQHLVHSETLLAGQRQVVIVHNNEHYVLRVTRQGKLILNK